MTLNRALRWLGPVAVAAIMTGTVAAPGAAAQSDPVSLDVFLDDTVVPIDGTALASFSIQASRAVTLPQVRLTFDLSGIEGVASVDPDSIPGHSCTSSGTQLECDSEFEQSFDELGSVFELVLVAEPGGAVGDTGELTLTVEADGTTAATHQSTVTLGAPADLAIAGPAEVTSGPGQTLSLPWTVHNAGPEPANGVALRINQDFVLRPQTLHRNCVYFTEDNSDVDTLCTFDVVLEPGTTYEFATPLEIAVGDDAQAPGTDAIDGSWVTSTEAVASRIGEGGTPGTGAELTLVAVGGGTPDPLPADPVPTADPDQENNGILTQVVQEGDNQPDFAAVGAEVSGEDGETVAVEVGVRNAGTATADTTRIGDEVNIVHITVPDGVTAVVVPGDCAPLLDDGQLDLENVGAPGRRVYSCPAGLVLPAGEAALFDFGLRIDEVIPDATGLVEVNQPPGVGQPTEDVNPDNDTAEIVVNPSGGGGELPVTGSATGPVALTGLLLVGVGTAGIVLVRRRRTRFVV